MRPSPTSPSRSSRRDLLRSGVALAAAMGPVSACSWLSTTPETKKEPPRVAKGKEAPALAERVKQGKLPALEKRLPARPMVLEPVEQVGIYGGTWDTTILGPSDTAWLDRTVGYENLVRWDTKFEKVIPNVAERYNVTDDGRAFVFHLRAGSSGPTARSSPRRTSPSPTTTTC